MVLGKRPKYQQKQVLNHWFLFIIQNVASGYTLCHLENWHNKNSIIKTDKHCTKYVQNKTRNKFCKTKCVKLNFYKFVHFLLF